MVILKNRNKNWKILTNFWKFSDIFSFFSYLNDQKGNSVFSRSSANFGEDSRSREVIKSIPWGIEEWKKVRDFEERGTRNSSCHPYHTQMHIKTALNCLFLITGFKLLKLLSVVCEFGWQTYDCRNNIQNICSVV